MKKYLLDTNVLIALLNGALEAELPDGDYYFATVSRVELLSHAALSLSELLLIDDFLSKLAPIDLSTAVQAQAASLRRSNKIKLPDAVIVATAIVHDCILLTNDKALQKLEFCNAIGLSLKQ